MDKLLNLVLSSIVSLNVSVFAQTPDLPQTPDPAQSIEISQPIKTQSRFEEKTETKEEVVEFKTIRKDDPEKDSGEESVESEGKDGKTIKTYKITYYEDKEYSRELTSTQTLKPQDKVIKVGTKVVWKTLDTPQGQIKYWKKMRVYATHYDSKCPGCNETTAIGLRAGKGVIAVDPSVIKMRSSVYIPGYGQAIAGDTGGAIKGNIIDLGFDDARTAGWQAKYIDIYLL